MRIYKSGENEKSVTLIVTGILCILFPGLIVVWKTFRPSLHHAPVLDCILYGLLVVAGILMIIAGSGLSYTEHTKE
jgi:hypothetical protein